MCIKNRWNIVSFAKVDLPQVLKPKTPKVYKSKKLNSANYGSFNHNDYQVFLQLVSKMGGVDKSGKYLQPDQLQREYSLDAKEFSEMFNVSLSNCYSILKKAVDKLMKADIKIGENDDNSAFCRINVCSKAEYKKREGIITVKFTDDIMPYLAQVKQRFVLYNLKDIAGFGSLYTTRLYEIIQEFKETGWVIKSINQLREIFAVGNNLKIYSSFKRRTFAHACQEINSYYDLNLKFEEIKEKRQVVAVKFSFNKTAVIRSIDPKTGNARNLYVNPTRKNKRTNSTKLNIPPLPQDTNIRIDQLLSNFLQKPK